ncbi:MAG TPA: hypothetical protein VI432_00855 [Candidatus Paceibacterota bacterium]
MLSIAFYLYRPYKTFEIVVKNNEIQSLQVGMDESSVPRHLYVNKGDWVIIKITVDQDSRLYISGYDKDIDIETDKEAKIYFKADDVGVFQLELSGSSADLGVIEVLSR